MRQHIATSGLLLTHLKLSAISYIVRSAKKEEHVWGRSYLKDDRYGLMLYLNHSDGAFVL